MEPGMSDSSVSYLISRKKLASICEKGDSVAICNCELKPARQSDKLEVIMKTHSVVNTSPKQFEVKDISTIGSSEITLDNLAHMSNFDKVSFSAKVIHVNNPIHVSGGKIKQDVTVADPHGSVRLTVWEDDVGKFQENLSYNFRNLLFVHTCRRGIFHFQRMVPPLRKLVILVKFIRTSQQTAHLLCMMEK